MTITRDLQTGIKINFMQKDRLGSTTQILDESGTVLHTKSYDAFGKPRNGDWSDMAGGLFQAKLDFNDTNGTIDLTKRGFTDHEHLDEMQLIHMNGRMFDYNNGRFLSVDPFIQAPTNTQSLNPYTYIFNNPLSGTDPTGYIADTLFDAASIVYDIGKIVVGSISGDDDLVSEGKVDLAADTVAVLIPFVPAGSTKVARALKESVDSVSDANKSSKAKVATKNGNKNKSQTSTTKKNKSVSNTGSQKSVAQKDKPTQRAATREAKRKSGIPTSQQATKQTSPRTKGNKPLGREQEFETPKSGGGTEKKAVIISRDQIGKHAGVPTAEAGKVKVQDGIQKRTRSGKTSLENEGKSRVEFICKKDGGDC